MGVATLTLTDKDGQIDLMALYEGGFDVSSPAHQHMQDLIGLMDQIAQPVGERQHLSASDILNFNAKAQENVSVVEG